MLKLALCVALVGCGNKDEPKPGKPVADTPAPPARPSKVDPPEARPPTPPPPPPPTDTSLGQCTFAVSGAATANVTAFGGISAVSLSYWTVDPKTRDAMYKDKQGLIINCATAETSISFTANKLSADELPFGAKKYVLEKGLKNKVHVIGRMADGAILGGQGTLEITAMDAEHIAGSFDFTSELLKKNAGGRAPLGVKGSFDFKCPGKCK